jgi:transposase
MRSPEWSRQHSYNIWVERATQIKKSIGMQRGKNDKVDAKRIGIYAFRYQDQAKIFEPPRKLVEELKQLLNTRQRFIKTKNRLEVPLKEVQEYMDKDMYKRIASFSKQSLKSIRNSIKKVEATIKQLISQDQKLSQIVKFVTSVDGVGLITAVSLIAATNEFKSVQSGKQLACYVGVAPFSHKSG